MIETEQAIGAYGPFAAILESLFGRTLAGESTFTELWPAASAVLLLTALAAWWLRRLGRSFGRRGCDSPAALFDELCDAHALDRTSRRLLREMAAAEGLDEAARLFLEPERFEPSALDATLAAQPGRVQELRDKLFGGDDAGRRTACGVA